MLIDLLKFSIKQGKIAEATELFVQQMKNISEAEGCLLSKALQSKTNLNDIYLLLVWENPEDIEKHSKTEHDSKFREDLASLIVEPPELFDWETIA